MPLNTCAILQLNADIYSREYAKTGILFGVLGLITGAIWANYTWGEAWSNDPKQLLAAIALLIYAAYFILTKLNYPIWIKAQRLLQYIMYLPLPCYFLPLDHTANGGKSASRWTGC